MKIFKSNYQAIAHIRGCENLEDKQKYTKDILYNGICKIDNTIIVVDELNLLD